VDAMRRVEVLVSVHRYTRGVRIRHDYTTGYEARVAMRRSRRHHQGVR
jgi:hypothetical protein